MSFGNRRGAAGASPRMRTAPGRAARTACAPSPGPRFGRKALVLAVCALAACLCAGAAFATGEAGNGKFAVSDAPAAAAEAPVSSSESVLSFGGGVVTVAGDGVPEGTSLVVEDLAAADPAAIPELGGAAGPSGLEDALLVWDISLKDADGDEWQPYEEGSCVALTLDLAAAECGVEDGDVVTLTHVHEGVARDYDYVVVDGRITFWTDSFSIYVVSSTSDTSGTPVSEGGTYGMTVGEEKIFYYDYPTSSSTSGGWPSQTTTTRSLVGAVWSVEDGSGAVSYTVYDSGYVNGTDGAFTWKAQWIKVAAKNAGTVEVTATCYYKTVTTTPGGGPGGSSTTSYETATEAFTIVVSEKTGFHVEDRIPEDGCLVPAWGSEASDEEGGWTYSWTRDDGQAVRSEALGDDGAVNVSIDRGGVTNSRKPITYTVTASREGADEETASFTVDYAQEVLNPSFETPELPDGVSQRQFYNGYEGLRWRTTAPGEGSTLGLDVEIWSKGNGGAQAPTVTPDGGDQFAELNSEEAGALYQDVLTTSGAAFSWSFSHAARVNTGKDDVPNAQKMYVVVGASADAQAIVDNEKIRALIAAAASSGSIPDAKSDGSDAGLEFSYDANGDGTPGTYFIWQHTAATKTWTDLKGSCRIPDGQYLTRLFFVADPNQEGDGLTHGNFIDAVDAGEKMSYRVEYYPDGKLDSDKTESGTGAAYTAVGLENLQGYLDGGYVVTSVEVNGGGYPGDIEGGLYVTDYGAVEGQEENILVKVTLRKKAVTVTKVLDVEGWDGMTDERKAELVEGYKAEFGLYEEGAEKPKATATLAVAGVSSDGTVSVTGEFGEVGNGTYIVKEIGWGEIGGYALSGTVYEGGDDLAGEGGAIVGKKVTVSDESPVVAVTVTNSYTVADTSLKISKTVTDLSSLKDGETFVFTVTGGNLPSSGMQVVISGADVRAGEGTASVTIDGLKVGSSYTVAEDGSWSWRYTPDAASKTSDVLVANPSGAQNTVTFVNEKTNDKWLDFSGWCRNLFKGSGAYDGVGVGQVTGGAARPAAQAS